MTQTDNETIYGLDLTVELYDDHQFKFVKAKWSSHELGLFGSKWFDYRFLHPTQATYLFAHHFSRIYRAFFAATIDRDAAEHIKPMKHEDLFQCPRDFISGMWRARQHADAIGIPYDLYLRLAFEAVLKYWKRRHLPRPTQLYSDHVVNFVVEQWEKRQEAQLHFGRHVEFRAPNYVGTPAQNDHHEWLFAQIAKRANAPALIARLVYEDEVLPFDKLAGRYDAQIVADVREAA